MSCNNSAPEVRDFHKKPVTVGDVFAVVMLLATMMLLGVLIVLAFDPVMAR